MQPGSTSQPAGPYALDGVEAGAFGALGGQDLRSAFANAPIGMAVLTPDGVITGCNAQVGVLLSRPADMLLGRTFFDVTHPDDLDGAREACGRVQQGGRSVVRHDVRLQRADGSYVWVCVSTSRVPGVEGRPAHLIMHLEDVDDRKALEATLLHRSLHDPLTGLANRSLLTDRIEQALARGARGGAGVSLLLLDLNGFKSVNDTFGHPVGDVVLQQLALRVTSVLRPGDTAARLGGDELVVLCEQLSDDQVTALAERLRAVAAEPYLVEGHSIALTAAVGCSTAPPGGRDPLALMRAADLQMYQDKGRQRPRITAT